MREATRTVHEERIGAFLLEKCLQYIFPPFSLYAFTSPGGFVMGVKMLQCFPFYRRCKERCRSRQCPPAAVPIEEMKPRLSSTTSWSSESEGAGSLSRGSQIYFSSKARLSFRHQLDSNINAVDATY
ncbi:uncharacterized protein PAE49_021306 [Odontesthes bonariensis]|uniref:uncharacterized protein LOC142368648 n=1 Tax=Odontesthes bonariensis TaxID=219752 RepID=UPI003F58ED9D